MEDFDVWVVTDAGRWSRCRGLIVEEASDEGDEWRMTIMQDGSSLVDERVPKRTWEAVEVLACGICGTDVASFQGFLPFSFPLVIGHEVVASLSINGKETRFLVEINVSHWSQDLPNRCGWCQESQECSIKGASGLQIHCPVRRTIGIDRIVGGTSPFMLVPKRCLVPIPEDCTLSNDVLCLCEPLAAAIQAIK